MKNHFKMIKNVQHQKIIFCILFLKETEMETETIETKKCNNCLKRVSLEYLRCPHCREDDFIYDGAVIVCVKSRKFNPFKSIAALFKKLKND